MWHSAVLIEKNSSAFSVNVLLSLIYSPVMSLSVAHTLNGVLCLNGTQLTDMQRK